MEQLPPDPPDFNPIENAWSAADDRRKDTDPAKLETHPEFKARANNAAKRVNANKKDPRSQKRGHKRIPAPGCSPRPP